MWSVDRSYPSAPARGCGTVGAPGRRPAPGLVARGSVAAGLVMVAAAMLAGCDTAPARSAEAAPSAQAARLTPGMSEAEVAEIFGAEDGFERNPVDIDQTCLSFDYGTSDAPVYVHAVFDAGTLIRATDGHAARCTFEAAAFGA